MPTDAERVVGVTSCCKGDHREQEAWREWAPNSDHVEASVRAQFEGLVKLVREARGAKATYDAVEGNLIGEVFRLGRLLVVLFLCVRQEQQDAETELNRGKERYRQQPRKARWLGTYFGKVVYWRSYLEQLNGRAGGYYPLDAELGLSADGFSLGMLSRAAQLATRMSYAAATVVMSRFLGWSPSHKSIEKAVLGLGSHVAAWVEQRPAPAGDGEVLVIQFDSKATPTVRQRELERRRGERRTEPCFADSPRHRGRRRRLARGSKPRRHKGDKSKNGKMTTVVVMYTLRHGVGPEGEPILKGPINRWHYASYGPKRHAFAIARREADKRGFSATSGKTVQIVTDGDEDLERYAQELFAEAKHSLDVIHVVEYLWKAGACLHAEGSHALRGWVEKQKDRLYAGQAETIVRALRASKQDAPSEKKMQTLDQITNYLHKRLSMMNYGELTEQDLELSSGMVEGAVRYIVAQRFDEGGMRWIRERAEPLLQLRCIEINGDWDDFIAFVSKRLIQKQRQSRRQMRLLRNAPEPLPTYGVAC